MSNPFGDSNVMGNDVAEDLSDFAAPVDHCGDFFEAAANEASHNVYENQMDPNYAQHMKDSYPPQSYGSGPLEQSTGSFHAETPTHIPAVDEDNELTKFMEEYERKISLKAQEQEKVAIECKAKAEEDMAQFLAERQRIKESKLQANRVFEQATLEKMVADLQNENPWERVVTLVDLETSRKKRLDLPNSNESDGKKQQPMPVAVPAKKTPEDEEDVSRMRQLFVQLKASPLEHTRVDAVATN
ncbi:hypothetical protein CCR75_001650 [Bremia lactucae]|uniref:Clathrin light chain n=1 Tax=Bremia lactucae TaxID=4779 RepID=A0A976IFD4_BRELC|nr:hypothetical protein CCR75_001650 [Bremia lactucae]